MAAACDGASHSTTRRPSSASLAAIESPVLLAPRTTTASLLMGAKDQPSPRGLARPPAVVASSETFRKWGNPKG